MFADSRRDRHLAASERTYHVVRFRPVKAIRRAGWSASRDQAVRHQWGERGRLPYLTRADG